MSTCLQMYRERSSQKSNKDTNDTLNKQNEKCNECVNEILKFTIICPTIEQN